MCVHSTGAVGINVHMCGTITAGSAHALVCAQFVVLCLYIFDAGGSVLECMRVYAHTHTYCTWGAQCEPRGRDEAIGGPQKSRLSESRQTCIRVCVQCTRVYIYAVRRDEIWNNSFFL